MDVGTLVAAAVALAVAVGGYIQFVLQRSIFPCIEFDAGLLSLDPSGPGRPAVGELVRSMKNVGPGVGYVANVIYRVKYRRADEVALGPDAYLVHAWGTFEYHIDVGRLAWVLARFLTQRPDRRLVPYNLRRTFPVGTGTSSRWSGPAGTGGQMFSPPSTGDSTAGR